MSLFELYELFTKYYGYLYQKVLHYNNFCFNPNENQIKQVSTFINYLDELGIVNSIGEEWIFQYEMYLFKERLEQKTRFDGKKIPLNWILGQKAYELFEKRNENWLYFNDLFRIKYKLSIQNFNLSNELKSIEFDESIRRFNQRFDNPIYECLEIVNFNNKSEICKNCVDVENCKILNSIIWIKSI